MKMIEILIFAKDEIVGGAFVYKQPIETRHDCRCIPKDFLSYGECEAIGKDLAENKTCGVVREYKWKVTG